MSVLVCRREGTQFATVDPGCLNVTYEVNCIGHLSRAVFSPDTWETQTTYRLDEKGVRVVAIVNALLLKTVENIHKISQRLNLRVSGTGIDCCRSFKEAIQDSDKQDLKELNLSRLGIDSLPFHIGLFRELEYLDLSHNKFRVLPRDLSLLQKLKVINLKGNQIIDLPEWMRERKNLIILFDEPDIDPDDMAQDEL